MNKYPKLAHWIATEYPFRLVGLDVEFFKDFESIDALNEFAIKHKIEARIR